MSGKARPARFRAAEALKWILDEGNETNTSLSSESGSDYEDNVSQTSLVGVVNHHHLVVDVNKTSLELWLAEHLRVT